MTVTEALAYTQRALKELREFNRTHRLPMSRHNWDAYKDFRGLTDREMSFYFVIEEKEMIQLTPNEQVEAAGLISNRLCQAQLKKVAGAFHDDVCSMAEKFPTAKQLTDFINKWQALLKECEE